MKKYASFLMLKSLKIKTLDFNFTSNDYICDVKQDTIQVYSTNYTSTA